MKLIPEIQIGGGYADRVLTAQLRERARTSQRKTARTRREAHAAAKAQEAEIAAARQQARVDAAYNEAKAQADAEARVRDDAQACAAPGYAGEDAHSGSSDGASARAAADAPHTAAQAGAYAGHGHASGTAADDAVDNGSVSPGGAEAHAETAPGQGQAGQHQTGPEQPSHDDAERHQTGHSDPDQNEYGAALRPQPSLALVTAEAPAALAALQPSVPAGSRPHIVWPPRIEVIEPAETVADAQADASNDAATETERRSWSRRVRILVVTAAGGAAMVSVMAVAAAINYPAYEALRARHAAVPLTDTQGRSLGVMAPPDGTKVTMASGLRMPQVQLASKTADSEVVQTLDTLEGRVKILGISPHYTLRAAVCSAVQAAGFEAIGWLGLYDGRCAGASTPEMQSSRTTRNDQSMSWGRKFIELADSIGMNLAKSDAEREIAILDSLHYGQAAGFPLHGQRIAALAAFGGEPETLPLEKKALLASFPKEPLKLVCRVTGFEKGDVAAFERQRKRARKALIKGFAGHPGLAAALARLDAMAPIVSPAPLAPELAVGLSPLEACQVAAHPLARGAVVAGTHNLDVTRLPLAGGPIAEVRLAQSDVEQRRYRTAVLGALKAAHNADWLANPVTGEAVTLTFDTDKDGSIRHQFEGGIRGLLNQERESASLSKFGAVLILAKANFPASGTLCNHEAQGRQNAGGNKGFANCSAKDAHESIDKVFGLSRNLPVYYELRTRFTADQLRREADVLGFRVGADPAADFAFGTARISPARISALMTAMSNALAGQSATAPVPHLARAYRDVAGWHGWPVERVDLTAYFTGPNARELVRKAAQAPLLYSNGRQNGTLQMTVGDLPVGPAEVGKSGTQDNDGLTRGKFAAGARDGRGWFAMVIARRNDLGKGHIGIWQLSRIVRATSFGSPAPAQSASGQSPSDQSASAAPSSAGSARQLAPPAAR